ncbi:MAG: hypothetical protein HeimC3_40750 [Candidatus Heimdallarchaeota archaeon LC_3]|nr:MAG: hypothetical protein HeimC3_40750 [Candidatus Heimdallarchaeota archaeon LC_3]
MLDEFPYFSDQMKNHNLKLLQIFLIKFYSIMFEKLFSSEQCNNILFVEDYNIVKDENKKFFFKNRLMDPNTKNLFNLGIYPLNTKKTNSKWNKRKSFNWNNKIKEEIWINNINKTVLEINSSKDLIDSFNIIIICGSYHIEDNITNKLETKIIMNFITRKLFTFSLKIQDYINFPIKIFSNTEKCIKFIPSSISKIMLEFF